MKNILSDNGGLDKILCFDIETRQHERADLYINKEKTFRAPANYKNDEAKEKYITEAKLKELSKSALNIPTMRVWVISAYDMETDITYSYADSDEAKVIEGFYKALANEWKDHVLVGYNNLRFDNPVLRGASVRTKIPVPSHLRFPAKTDDIVNDFYQMKLKLSDLGHMMGMEKSMDGSDVHSYWMAHCMGDKTAEKEVVAYCEHDVLHCVEYIRRVYGT